jgi:two-component system cell cycle sensor histidine kinase/response regulator CckA
MAQTLRVLIVEDNQRDAALLVRELKRGGYDLTYERVETLEAMQGALGRQSWDLVVSDYSMPRFSAPAALNAVRAAELDLPFIIVSGTIGEDTAVAAMRAGASDFMQKGQLTRLLPAVARELREALRRAGHRAIEQQLRHAQKMETMGQLTGGIAHDFNNMLSVIVAHLEMLKELMGGDPARVELIDGALNGAMGGADLIKRLLAFARQQPLSATTMDLNSRLPDTVAMLKRTLGEDIRISTSLAPDLWTVRLDPSQLEDAVLNLAINSRDAMPDGGALRIETANVRLNDREAQAHIDVTPGDYVRLSVTDTGTGISAEIVERVTEPFFTTKEPGKGTGLGLSMIYGFAKQSGGHLTISSENGVGTIVSLFFPRVEAETAAASIPSKQATIRLGSARILVVEDNASVRNATSALLGSLGYQVEAVESAKVALSRLMERAFDVVFSDVVMPDMNGIALAREVRRSYPNIGVLLTSGFSTSLPSTIELRELGAGFLPKPYRKMELAAAIETILDESAVHSRRATA